MKKIEKLTPEQEAYLPVFRAEWLALGLSTARVDKDRSTAAVKALYAAAGESEPVVMHFDSPAQCIMAINFFRRFKIGAEDWANLRDNLWDNLVANLRDNLGANLSDNLWDNLRDNLGDNLGANLRDNLWDNLWDNLRDNLGANLSDNLWDNLWDNLGANLSDNLSDNLGANFWEPIDTWFWAGQDAPWLAFYEFGKKIGVKYSKDAHFEAYLEYARSSGWMYAYKGIAFVSDRPNVIAKDEESRLHSEVGPSIAFSDGYAMYSWHGTTVPQHWIENRETLDPAEVLKTENTEQRAAGAAIIGWAKMLDVLDAKVIDSDPNPDHGDLIELTLPGLPEPGRFLRAYCKRNGLIVDGVPRTSDIDGQPINTVLAAQAWSFGKSAQNFKYPDHVS